MWINPNNTFGAANTGLNNTAGRVVPCNANSQSWTYPNNVYSGQIIEIPEELKDYSIQGKWRVPINYHTGIMGLAPKTGAPVITGPPTRTGGNVDDQRMGVGATMYYPVEVAGGLLSMGDVHGAMGDGESGGTGIETSIEAKFRVTLHKKDSLPKPVSKLNYPLLENANEYVIHGYAYADYLREVPNPQYNITSAGNNFRRAMDVIYNQTREFVMTTFDLEEDYAINVMSNTVNFGITQIVDANVGLHAIIPKWPFNASAWESEPYYQAKTMPGTSRPFGAP
jgi:acetamidase/formamidase